MGSNPSTLRKNLYLTKDEIEKSVSKNSINIIQSYKKLKNPDGLLTTNELNIITYGLINAKTRKKIIQINLFILIFWGGDWKGQSTIGQYDVFILLFVN